MNVLAPGQAVRINTPENPRLHNSEARITSVWARDVAVYHLEAPAAATGKYRALAHEIIPDYLPDHERPTASPRGQPEARLAEFSGIPRRLPESIGELCEKCGGLMVRTGTCKTCNTCGNNTGGCG